ncbi:diacylglycerol acyltransferase [Phlyctema vagabunda]|uniref:diacylglycerol O-acyltransferase n=1 Tax=Phlyctema vagabunda TaxID=108571 RepID=A0ABR4PKK8_9HELO
MPTAVAETPNGEPAHPDESRHQNLAAKSYADAVEEDAPAVTATDSIPPSDGRDGSKQVSSNAAKGKGKGKKAVDENNDSKPPQRTAAVLRIVDTGAPGETKEKEERPPVGRQESQREFSAEGLDDTPRTPPRQKPGKRKSASSQGSSKDDGSPQPRSESDQSKVAQPPSTEDDKSTQSKADDKKKEVKFAKEEKTIESSTEQEEKPSQTKGDKSRKKETNGSKKDETSSALEFEKVEVERNGSRLVSIKPVKEIKHPREDRSKEDPKQGKEDSLVSGKKAGQRWEQSAIRFAPLNVPLRRRLQTLVVLFHTLCIALSVSAFFFLCAIPLFWPLLVPYLAYCLMSSASTSGTLSHRSDFLRKSPIWSLFASYFPARLHRTQELPPTRKYIFGYHPHGIISHGAFAAFGTESLGFSQLFPGIKNTLLTLDSNFRIPLYRDYALALGLASVSKESCENLLSKGGTNKEGMGRAITIVVGGARESLDAQPYSLRLVLKRRKGFVKMAIRTGADLVPVLAFGENDLYDQFLPDSHPKIHKFQLLVKKLLGFTIPLFHARGVFNYDVGLMPYRRPLNIVVGRPIRVRQSPKPEQEEIDKAHEEYVQELERLWDTWKDEFAPRRTAELEILE